MSMNWHQRRHGWACGECGAFNEEGNFNCDGEECEADRKRDVRDYVRRGLIHRFRQERRDEVIVPAPYGKHRYRFRRYVGWKVSYRVEVDKHLRYAVEFWRVPDTVWMQAKIYWGIA